MNRHIARGLCTICYYKDSEKNRNKHEHQRKYASKVINREYLRSEYIDKKKSLGDIAINCKCTRTYIYKMIKFYKLPLRTKQQARKLALLAGKIQVNKENEDGSINTITYSKIDYNIDFFRNWSEEMAYVLGLLFTDGCMSIQKQKYENFAIESPQISFAQKEKKLVAKVLFLMNCNAKIYHRQQKKYGTITAGEIYSFNFDCRAIYDDLIRLGLKPRKSLDITFPPIPNEYIRHFIRGCWDGDGSVYIEKRSNRISASFVSGSRAFIQGIVKELTKARLPPRTIHTRKSNTPSYYFRYTGEQCRLLYRFLYADVSPKQYLERKYIKFKNYFGPLALKSQKPIQSTLF